MEHAGNYAMNCDGIWCLFHPFFRTASASAILGAACRVDIDNAELDSARFDHFECVSVCVCLHDLHVSFPSLYLDVYFVCALHADKSATPYSWLRLALRIFSLHVFFYIFLQHSEFDLMLFMYILCM
jgi:hypothetical protein